jgi:hypothetical protein
MTALDSARHWLAELLSAGPVASSEVKEAAAQAGHTWGTVRRAAAALNVETDKRGSRWQWRLPSPAPGAQVEGAQGAHAQVAQVARGAVVPIRPRPAPQATAPQARAPEPPAPRGPWFGPAREREKVWSAAGVVRCAGCRHCGKIQERNDFGFCPVGEQRVLYIYANRRCSAFEVSTAPTDAKG